MKRRELNEAVDAQINHASTMAIRAAVQKATGALFEAGVTPEGMAKQCEIVAGYLCRIADALRAKGGAR